MRSFYFPIGLLFGLGLALAASTSACDGGSGGSTSSSSSSSSGEPPMCSPACHDENPCTDDVCVEGDTCTFTKRPDGPAPDNEQSAGECKRIDCQDGQPIIVNDDIFIPDDHESCTADTCVSGTANHEPKPDDTPCIFMGEGGKCSAGVCTPGECSFAPCPDPGPCAIPFCDQNTGDCVPLPLEDGTPTPGVQIDSQDCVKDVCMGGQSTLIPNDLEVPLSDNDMCTDDLCIDGMAVYQPITPCP